MRVTHPLRDERELVYPLAYCSYPYHSLPVQCTMTVPLELSDVHDIDREKGTPTVLTVRVISFGTEVFWIQGVRFPILMDG